MYPKNQSLYTPCPGSVKEISRIRNTKPGPAPFVATTNHEAEFTAIELKAGNIRISNKVTCALACPNGR
jgi:hypothetical protein